MPGCKQDIGDISNKYQQQPGSDEKPYNISNRRTFQFRYPLPMRLGEVRAVM